MNWINIQTATLRSPQFIGSDPTARGTWLAVLGYCYEQENGGKICGCIDWKDRQWQQICGVTRDEIDGSTLLMEWQGNDLCVWSYPIETEDELKAKRAAGSKGGKARTKAKIEAARANGAKHNPSTTQAQPKQPPNEIEKKGKEIEKETEAPVPVAEGGEAPVADCPFPPEVAKKVSARELEAESVWALYPKKKGKKDAMREILEAIRTVGIERIRESTQAYAAAVSHWPEDERKYVPDPVRWFKRGNYDDDPETWQRKSANGVPQLEAHLNVF